jgi:outer membrane autotransporter protein
LYNPYVVEDPKIFTDSALSPTTSNSGRCSGGWKLGSPLWFGRSRRRSIGQNILPKVLLVSSLLIVFISQVALGDPPIEYWASPLPTGIWHTNSWSSSSPAVLPLEGWADANSAVFSATGAGPTGNFTVTLDSSVVVQNLTYTGGNLGSTLQIAAVDGNAITMANAEMNITVDPLTTLGVAPSIVGVGSLILNGGTLVLTGTNTYTGGTTISAGTLQLGIVGAQGSIVGPVTNNDTFNIVNSDTAGITTITNNFGTTNFFNTSTAGTATILNDGGFTAFFNTSSAGTAHITNNGGSTEFFDTSSANHAAIITNDGGFTEFFDSSTAGSTLINVNAGGETDFHNSSNAGNSAITNDGGVTNFNDVSSASHAHITNNPTATINFNDTSTAGNATISNEGGVNNFNNASTAANAIIANIFNGTTNFNNTSTAGHAAIADHGGVTNFTSASTAGNAVIVNDSGFVNPGLVNSGEVSSGVPPSTPPGMANFNDTSTAASATIMDIGGITNFNDASTAGGAIITNEAGVVNPTVAIPVAPISLIGITNFNNASTAGNASILNSAHGETEFFDASTAGNSTITTNSGGATLFFATSTGGQARLITNAGGIVNISGLASAGMTAGSIEGAGTYLLGSKSLTVGSNNLSTTVSGVILDGGLTPASNLASGTGGALIKVGTGILTLTGFNTYSGGTSFNGGAVAVNSDANLGTGPLSFNGGRLRALAAGGGVTTSKSITLNAGGGTFFADAGTVSTFSAAISGPGSLTKDGRGTLGLAGQNTYQGGTVLNGGTLTVNSAQALGLGNVTVNRGILRADPQPINVKGNYTQAAGGTLQLQVAGASPGQYDTLNVGGNAALGGTLQVISLGFQPKAGNQLTLVSTGGVVSGRFAQFIDPFSTVGFTIAGLVYNSNSVLLEFRTAASFALTPNQSAAASLIDAVHLEPGAAKLIAFLNTEPFADLAGDFEKISPDGLTAFYEISFSNANIQRLNLEDRLDNLRAGSNGFSSNMKVNGASVNLEDRMDADGKSSKAVVEPALQHTPENRWGVWVTGFGDFVSVDADSNGKGYDFTTGGASLGIDYRITEQLAIGAMGEYSRTWTDLNPGGHIDVDSGRGGLYATWFNHGIYLNGAIYGGHNNYDSGRPALGGVATGGTEGEEWSTFLSGGYDFHLGALVVGPIGALQYTDVHIDGFSENGSLAPLAIHSDSEQSLRSDVGFRAFYQWQIGKVLIEPSLKAVWEHEYEYSALPITAGFSEFSSPSATFFGPSEGHDSAVISAGISGQLTPAVTVYVNYDGQLGRGNYSSNAVTGGLRFGF